MTPISFEFVAAGIARRARISLARLKPSQVNAKKPSWEGHDGEITTTSLKTPISGTEYLDGRYVLTKLTFKKENREDLVMNDAIVTITQDKNIVRTNLVGLQGTIKEYICEGDYDISITVGIVAVDSFGNIVDEYPEEGIKEVKSFLDESKSISVSSVFLSIFNINKMVVTRFSLRQDTDSNRQVIEIKALSDQDYTIKDSEY